MKKLFVLMLAFAAFIPSVDACDCGCADLANDASEGNVRVQLILYNQCIDVCPDAPCVTDVDVTEEDNESVSA